MIIQIMKTILMINIRMMMLIIVNNNAGDSESTYNNWDHDCVNKDDIVGNMLIDF